MIRRIIFKGTPTTFIIALMIIDQDCHGRFGIRMFSGDRVPVLSDDMTLNFNLPGLEKGALHIRALTQGTTLLEICAPDEISSSIEAWWGIVLEILVQQGLVEGFQESHMGEL